MKGKIIFEINKILANLNLQIGPLGKNFRPAKQVLREAKKSGQNLNDYMESLALDERNRGQRNRVVKNMLNFISDDIDVLEIGSGTMRYSEYLSTSIRIRNYEIYETQKDWRKFASDNPHLEVNKLIVQLPNGRNLNATKTESIDLVHAHGVFVYLTFLETLEYLGDASRVLREDGVLIFDIFDFADLNQSAIENWLRTPHRFPSFLHGSILIDVLSGFNLSPIGKFKDFFGVSEVTYLVFKKS